MDREEALARHAASERRRRAEGKVDEREWRKAYRRGPRRDQVLAGERAKYRRNYDPEKQRGRNARFRAQNPDYGKARRERARQQERAYRERHPDMRSDRRRRERLAQLALVIRTSDNLCGICLSPLEPARRHPDPQSTSRGHEPPLAEAIRDGWTVVAERPEHLRCNLWKGDRHDDQRLPSHATRSAFSSIHEVIAAAAA